VWNYEDRTTQVRVAPFTKLVAVYRYEDRTTQVRVAPFTQTIPVWNYQETTTRVRVAPYVEEVPAYNYQIRTRPVAHTHPTTTTTTTEAPTTTTTTTTEAPTVPVSGKPTVSVAVYLFNSVVEGNPARFVVSVTPAPEQPYDVAVSVLSQSDFGVRSGVHGVTVPTSGRYFLDVATIDDRNNEPNGTITARAIASSRYNLGGDWATVTVKDNDHFSPPTTTTTTTTTAAPPQKPVVAAVPMRHHVSIVPQPGGLKTNSCWRKDVSESERIYMCRYIEKQTNYIQKSSPYILTTGAMDPTYGATLALKNEMFEGCVTWGTTIWKCTYRATRHWAQVATDATFKNYYLPALQAVAIPKTLKCVISIVSFLTGLLLAPDPTGVLDDCGALLSK